ncbi:methyltransferase domain-containing protein [Aspergillus pseudonomiae]|uniref:Protein-lysine N-methyltransferase EFM4 n=1 Tax=Aspergillus pseudonomiae TaxID=1506151 RepID=A0A5N6HN41_9EURO|nr:methyltransferase domain-containing protein [Aspergillus pseudonomiae]KAB8254770.1 methyltransferase domain-containing protein [Aspergillus pseudonomiae]KAE8399739.1 methyltransferase domain-containing protein [Aspergillus pseudonomiae]
MAEESHPSHLAPSELGTKDYWETFYARTLTHISTKQTPQQETTNADSDAESIDDDDDPGTSWFSEHNAPDKVLQFLAAEDFPLAPCNNTGASHPSILDLGTGNGSMLALLRKRGGFRGVMVGVDYSARSVELARELQRLKMHSAYLTDDEDEEEEGAGDGPEIRFEEWDILHSAEEVAEQGKLDWFPYGEGGFDIVLDKGTFDAVSLSEEVVEGDADASVAGKKVQRRVCEMYPGVARRLVKKGGFLVVTSCNWTEEELVMWFTREKEEGDRLEVWGRVEYPRFRFGGKEGQGVCTVCFQRV